MTVDAWYTKSFTWVYIGDWLKSSDGVACLKPAVARDGGHRAGSFSQ